MIISNASKTITFDFEINTLTLDLLFCVSNIVSKNGCFSHWSLPHTLPDARTHVTKNRNFTPPSAPVFRIHRILRLPSSPETNQPLFWIKIHQFPKEYITRQVRYKLIKAFPPCMCLYFVESSKEQMKKRNSLLKKQREKSYE